MASAEMETCNSIMVFMLCLNPGWLLTYKYTRVSCHCPSRSDFETRQRFFSRRFWPSADSSNLYCC